MGQLLVRDLDEALVEALKKRAAAHGRSAEAEHRAILEQALRGPKRRTLAEVLLEIPPVGHEEDFVRDEGDDDDHRVPD